MATYDFLGYSATCCLGVIIILVSLAYIIARRHPGDIVVDGLPRRQIKPTKRAGIINAEFIPKPRFVVDPKPDEPQERIKPWGVSNLWRERPGKPTVTINWRDADQWR